MRHKFFIYSLLALLFIQTSSYAIGALYARRALTEENASPLWLRTYDADVTITDQMAVTHITHIFRNETNMQLEGLFIFPLPENAVITELALWENGVRKIGVAMESKIARQQYESVVRKSIDPALLEYLGKNVFKLSVFPINPAGQTDSERKIEITYTELLPYDNGTIRYNFFMKTVNLSSKAIQRASIVMQLTAQNKVLSLSSPTHSNSLIIENVNDKEYKATYGQENAASEKDLVIDYQLSNVGYALKNATYTPEKSKPMFFDSEGDDSYYLLWITPPDSVTKPQIIPKNITFVADISSSMAGTRIEQLRIALSKMVGMLNNEDKFNIIPFSTGNYPFKDNLVSATDSNLKDAQVFIEQLGESGLTNIEGALKQALKSSFEDTLVNVIVFLTDGKPTWPIGSTSKSIIDSVSIMNKDSVSIFTFGIGDSIDIGFLRLLARNNSAFFTQINADDSIGLVMKNFMEKISYPLMNNIKIDCGGLSRYDIFPRNIPNIYSGSQVVQLGRFRNNGNFTIRCSGNIGAAPVSFSKELSFPETGNNPFVARMWASEKIDYLLEEISIYGESAELKQAVIDLSTKYNFITPYTSMVTTGVIQDKTVKQVNKLKLFCSTQCPLKENIIITFSIPKLTTPQMMTLKIFDAKGRVITTLATEMTLGGSYTVEWSGRNGSGKKAAPGFYVAILRVGNEQKMITMSLLK